MRELVRLMVFGLVGSAILFLGWGAQPVFSQAVGELVVVTIPDGAQISIDGNVMSGTTTFGPAELPVGAHTVELRLDGFAPERHDVEIKPGLTTHLTFSFKPEPAPEPPKPAPVAVGSLRIDSVPAGAVLQLNERPVGRTPVEIGSLPVGTYQFHLSDVDGFMSHTGRVDVRQGELVVASARLIPLGGSNGRMHRRYHRAAVASLLVVGSAAMLALVVVKRRRGTGSRTGRAPSAESVPPSSVTFGGYEIIEKIGSGGAADIYTARHPGLSELAVVKVPRDAYQRDEEFVTRFHDEAEFGRKLHNENVVKIFDFGRGDDGRAYLAMEYIEGKELRALLGRPLPVPEALDTAVQLCRALDYVHSKGFLHLDIKPENVMVTDRVPRRVVLMDFGNARAGWQVVAARNTILVTPPYASPELAQRREPGPASDLYQVGIVLFEMLTGRRPFEGNDVELLRQHVSIAAPSPNEFNPHIPNPLTAAVVKLLAKRPEERYQSADQLIVDLGRIRRGLAIGHETRR